MDFELEPLATALALVVLASFVMLLLSFNKLWYEPNLKPGQAPLPPGSLGWPVFGNMTAFLHAFKSENTDSFMEQYLRKYSRVGLYRAFLFWQPTILAATPETCKMVLSRDSLFETGWPSSTKKLIGVRSFAGVTGNEHKKLRKLTEPALNSPRALQLYIPQMVANIKKCLAEWSAKEHVSFLEEARKYAFLTVHDILLSRESILQVDVISSLYHHVNQGIRSLPINLPGTTYRRALKARMKLAKLFQRVINVRRLNNGEDVRDTLSLLMEVKDEAGKHLDDDQIIDLLMMFMNAGHESSAHLILWVVIMLHKHRDVYDKVKAEQDEIAFRKKPGEILSLNDIKGMSYLTKVIDETLRLVNISPMVFRKALTDVQMNGFTIPKGWHVEAWMRQVHMDPTVHENPLKFDPDRWTRNEVAPFTHIPFGLGRSTCPGNELAKMEASIVVHHLVTGYVLKPLNPGCEITYLPHPRPKDLFPVQIRAR